MTRLDTVDVDALAESLRADAKNSAAGIEEAAKAAALMLIEQGEDVIKNILVAQECYKLSRGMFVGAELACVTETESLLISYGGHEPIQLQGVGLDLNTTRDRRRVNFGDLRPHVELPSGRYRFVLIGYRLPDADGKED